MIETRGVTFAGKDLEIVGHPDTIDKLQATVNAHPALVAALRAAVENCEKCDRLGYIETYPTHSADAYNGIGDPVYNIEVCPCCGPARAALAGDASEGGAE